MASNYSDRELALLAIFAGQQSSSSADIFTEIETVKKHFDGIFNGYFNACNGQYLGKPEELALLYEVVDEVVQLKFMPWIRRIFPTLPKVQEDSFFELQYYGKNYQKINCSPFGTTELFEVPLNDFVLQNLMVAAILLLMYLCYLHHENKLYTMANVTSSIARKLVMKYVRVRKQHSSTTPMCFIVHTFILPAMCTSQRENRGIKYDEECFHKNFLNEVDVWADRIYPDIDTKLGYDLLACPVGRHLADWHLEWLLVHANVFVLTERFKLQPEHYGNAVGVTPSLEFIRRLNTSIQIYLRVEDYLMCAVHCWILAKCYFFLAWTADNASTQPFMDVTTRMISTVQRLEKIASKYHDYHRPFSYRLQQEGDVINNSFYYWNSPGTHENLELVDSIIMMLEEKRCPELISKKYTIPLLIIVARYNHLPRLQSPGCRPSQQDYLEILRLIRMYCPMTTGYALKVYALEHRRYKYLIEYGKKGLVEMRRFEALAVQLSCSPLLKIGVLIRTEYPALHGLGNDRLAIEKWIRESDRLTRPMESMKKKWMEFRMILKSLQENGRGAPLNLKSSSNEVGAAPEDSSQATPEVSSQATPEVSSQATPEVSSQATLEVSSQATLEVSSQATLEVSSQATLEVSSQAALEVSSQATPEVSSQATLYIPPNVELFKRTLETEFNSTLHFLEGFDRGQILENTFTMARYQVNLYYLRRSVTLHDVFSEQEFDFLENVFGGKSFFIEEDKLKELKDNLMECLDRLIKSFPATEPPGYCSDDEPLFENKEKLKEMYNELLTTRYLGTDTDIETLANWMENLQDY